MGLIPMHLPISTLRTIIILGTRMPLLLPPPQSMDLPPTLRPRYLRIQSPGITLGTKQTPNLPLSTTWNSLVTTPRL